LTALDTAAPAATPNAAEAPPSRRRSRRAASADQRLGRGAALGLGTSVLWLSLLVLLPLAAVVAQSFGNGWAGFWDAITSPGALQALKLTVLASLAATVINAVMGTLLAWVLVRDNFPGKRLVEVLIDVPFALPTIVAGVVLLSLYGTNSPVGVTLLGTQRGVALALLFVTLPFVVRTVQPVLMTLDTDAEQAAATLGAPPRTVFRRIVLPVLLPAIASGAALSFARAMGEYGSMLLISGGLQRATVSSMYIYNRIQNFDYAGAAATATVLLAVSLVVIIALDLIQRRAARRG
jgi:sulfate transport system permease protein